MVSKQAPCEKTTLFEDLILLEGMTSEGFHHMQVSRSHDRVQVWRRLNLRLDRMDAGSDHPHQAARIVSWMSWYSTPNKSWIRSWYV